MVPCLHPFVLSSAGDGTHGPCACQAVTYHRVIPCPFVFGPWSHMIKGTYGKAAYSPNGQSSKGGGSRKKEGGREERPGGKEVRKRRERKGREEEEDREERVGEEMRRKRGRERRRKSK